MSGPLSHLRVVEFAAIGPVPLAGQLLADLGAEVVIIDRLSEAPNPARQTAAQVADDAGEHGETATEKYEINRRGKLSVAIDLKSPQGLQVSRQLINRADVLLEGFRPGVMERLGLSADSFDDSNPGLIYGRMTGWGQSGPRASTAGHDINYLAITGALHAMGSQGAPPPVPLNLIADYGGGALFLLLGVLSALAEKTQSGKGQVVDAAMSEGVVAMMGLFHGLLASADWSNNRQQNMLDGAAPFYRCYETSDGKFLSVGALETGFFDEFLSLAGLPQLDRELRRDSANWPEMCARYEQHFKSRTRDEWTQVFAGSDACVEPVLDFAEAPYHPQSVARQSWLHHDGIAQSAPAPRFSRTPPSVTKPPARQGADTIEVLVKAGVNAQEIATLCESGVIRQG